MVVSESGALLADLLLRAISRSRSSQARLLFFFSSACYFLFCQPKGSFLCLFSLREICLGSSPASSLFLSVTFPLPCLGSTPAQPASPWGVLWTSAWASSPLSSHAPAQPRLRRRRSPGTISAPGIVVPPRYLFPSLPLPSPPPPPRWRSRSCLIQPAPLGPSSRVCQRFFWEISGSFAGLFYVRCRRPSRKRPLAQRNSRVLSPASAACFLTPDP